MKIKNFLSNCYFKAGLMTSIALTSTASFAEAPQSTNYLEALVEKVNVAPIITGIVAVSGTVMGVAVVVMGIKKVARMLNAF